MAALLQQLLGGAGAPGVSGAAGGPGAFPGMFGGMPGAGGAAGGMPGMGGPGATPGGVPGGMGMLGSMFGGGGAKKKASDSFFTDKLPFLQMIKRPVIVAFFAYCFYRGWIGRYGLLQGAMSSSYFDMLGVPLRVLPQSPIAGKAFFMTQIWADSGCRAVGFLINLARGKAKIPTLKDLMPQPPTGGGMGGADTGLPPWMAGAAGGGGAAGMPGASPFGMPSPSAMPTARTIPTPPPRAPTPPQPPPGAGQGGPQGGQSRAPPTVVDVDVTFLD